MKQNLTKLFKATALALFIITAGCSTDDNNDSHEHLHESPLVKTVPFEELIKQSRFNNAFNKLHKKIPFSGNEISSRTVMEQEYGFTIEDIPAKVIENDSTVSYTLLVSRTVLDAASFENLVLQVNKFDESITASLLKYNLTSPMVSSAHASNSFEFNVLATPIVYNVENATSKAGNVCIMLSIMACNRDLHGGLGEVHYAGPECKTTFPLDVEFCVDTSQGGGSSGGPVGGDGPSSPGTPNTGNNPGQSGGGGGNSGGTVVTSPVTMTPAQALTARKKAFSQKLRGVNLLVGFNGLPADAQGEIWNFLESSLTNGELTVIASAYPEEIVQQAVDIVISATNGSLVPFSPFFKYPVGSNYKVIYPNLTHYLQVDVPLLKNNSTIINAIKTYTPLTTAQIKNHLSWGKGPTIKIVQLDNFCTECDANTHGVFQPSDPNSVYIDVDLVNELENSAGNPLSNSFAFFIGVTILHEYVHYGDNLDGVDYPGEEGELFEIDVYGQIVTRENANIILSGN